MGRSGSGTSPRGASSARRSPRHGGPCQDVAFSPDGKTLASAVGTRRCASGTWRPAPARPAAQRQTSASWSVAFSPDGKTLASGERRRDGASGTSRATTQLRAAPQARHGFGARASPSAPTARRSPPPASDETVRLWDVATAQPARRAAQRARRLGVRRRLQPRRQDARLRQSTDKTVRLWDVATAPPARPAAHRPHRRRCTSVAFSPDGKTLASASGDKTVRLWDVASHRQLGEPLTGHGGAVASVAFSPDGKTLASGGGLIGRCACGIWPASALGRAAHRPHQRGPAPSPSAPTAERWPRLALTGRSSCGMSEPTARSAPRSSDSHSVYAVAFSPDGRTLAAASTDGGVRLLDVTTRREIGGPLPRPNPAYSVAFSPDGETLASAGSGRCSSGIRQASASSDSRSRATPARSPASPSARTARRSPPPAMTGRCVYGTSQATASSGRHSPATPAPCSGSLQPRRKGVGFLWN